MKNLMMNNQVLQFSNEQQIPFFKAIPAEEYAGELIADVIAKITRKWTYWNILDVGAGTGALLKAVKKRNSCRSKRWMFTGIDLVPKGDNIEYGDCTNLNFENNYFNTIFCTDVLEHLSDKNLILCVSEIYRVLKKGGYAIFLTNNKEALEQRIIKCPQCGHQFHNVGHCQSFNEERLRNLFSMFGFRVVKVKIANFGFIATFGWIAKLFYALKLYKLTPCYRITSEILVVVSKK